MDTTAFLIVLGGGFFHAAWHFVAKKVKGNPVVLWFGFGIVTLIYSPWAFFAARQHAISFEAWLLMILSGFLTAVYFFLLGKAYKVGEMSVCYPVMRGIGIAGTALLTPLFLQQYPSLSGKLGIALILLGTFLIGLRRNKFDSLREGLGYAVATGLLIVLYSLLNAHAVQTIHPAIFNIGFTFFAVLFLTPYIFSKYRKEIIPSWRRWKWQGIFIGFSSISVYFAVLFAFQQDIASYVVALRDTSIGFGALFGFIFLKEKLTWQKAVGLFAIICGAILIKLA